MIIRAHQLPTEQDLAVVADQLGRAPRGIEAIAATDSKGTPLALRMAPIVEGKPFPTLYWLSSERLKIEISHLEANGIIKQLEQQLREDSTFLAAYQDSHRRYVAERWHYMSEAQRHEVHRLGYQDVLTERGVGGISNWQQVRCLHTQYAHHLGSHNVIGQWMDEHCQIADCID